MEQDRTPRYRLLREGERVEVGDEHLCDDAETWAPLTGWTIGITYLRWFQPARRPVKEPANAE